jgi:RNA polymerase sigma-70 factor (ECF subfamily)
MERQAAVTVVDQLFESWYPHLLRYATRLVKQRSSAEEVVQGTFLDLYKTLRSGSDVQYPKAWTMCVVRRKVIERRNEHFGLEQRHESLESICTPAAPWTDELNLAIDCERLRKQVDTLSLREEEVLTLRLQSLKYREIAKALGISINSVNTLLARALEKLQKHVELNGSGAGKRGRAAHG